MEAEQHNSTKDKVMHSQVKHHQLLFSNLNILTLTAKELELVQEAKWYHLGIIGVSSSKEHGFEQTEVLLF